MLLLTFAIVILLTALFCLIWYIIFKTNGGKTTLVHFTLNRVLPIYGIFLMFLFLLPSLKQESGCVQKKPVFELFVFTKDYITELERGRRFFGNELLAWVDNPVAYQVLFNILIFIPIGYFLRQKYSSVKSLLFGACLSLLIEIIQLTQLFGLFPCGYRVFDVNDLLLNTVGVFLGIQVYWLIQSRKVKNDNHIVLYFVVYMSSSPQHEVFQPTEKYKGDGEKLDLHNRFTRMLTTTLEKHIEEIRTLFAPESIKDGEIDTNLLQGTELDKVFGLVERIVSYSSITVQLDAVRLLLASVELTQEEPKYLFLKHFLQLLQAKQDDLDNQETAA